MKPERTSAGFVVVPTAQLAGEAQPKSFHISTSNYKLQTKHRTSAGGVDCFRVTAPLNDHLQNYPPRAVGSLAHILNSKPLA